MTYADSFGNWRGPSRVAGVTIGSYRPGRCSTWHSIVRRALEDARRDELIGRNVAREVTPPRYERREFEPLTADEAREWIDEFAAANRSALRPRPMAARIHPWLRPPR
jgi:hypothetical protein